MIRVMLLVRCCSRPPWPARRRPTSSSTAGRCTRFACTSIRAISRSCERGTSKTVYVPADFEWRGIRVRNVGVRVRGLATRSAIKPGLRIDFNRYVAGQAFLGMSALVLDNALKDPSFMRERISMAFIKRMGQPAPRESFGRVYINGAYEGLYALVEAVDSAFLARELGDGLGYLFEHKFMDGFYGEFLGDDYAPYRLRFDAQTHRLESDYTLVRADSRAVPRGESGRRWRVAGARELVRRSAPGGHARGDRDVSRGVRRISGWIGDGEFLSVSAGGRPTSIACSHGTGTRRFRRSSRRSSRASSENALMSRALRFCDLRTLFLDVLEQMRALGGAGSLARSGRSTGRISSFATPHYEDGSKPSSNEEYETRDRPSDVVRPAPSGIRAGRSRQSSMRAPVVFFAIAAAASGLRLGFPDRRRPRAERRRPCWSVREISPCAAQAARWRRASFSTASRAPCSSPAISPTRTAARSSSAVLRAGVGPSQGSHAADAGQPRVRLAWRCAVLRVLRRQRRSGGAGATTRTGKARGRCSRSTATPSPTERRAQTRVACQRA